MKDLAFHKNATEILTMNGRSMEWRSIKCHKAKKSTVRKSSPQYLRDTSVTSLRKSNPQILVQFSSLEMSHQHTRSSYS